MIAAPLNADVRAYERRVSEGGSCRELKRPGGEGAGYFSSCECAALVKSSWNTVSL